MSSAPDLALLRRINLNQLIGFLVVAEARSFREAATHLQMSQSALSMQVHLLEQALGVPLFHRTTRSVSPTREGSRLLPAARLLARELSLAASEFRDEAAVNRGVATLITIPTLSPDLVPGAIKRLANAYPGVQVKLQVLDASNAVAQVLRDGGADVGILNARANLGDLSCTPLVEDEHVAVAPASLQALADRTEISLRELAGFPFLVQPRGTSIRELVQSALQAQGSAMRVRQELLDAAGLVALAASGLGVAVVPIGALSMSRLERVRVLRLPELPLRTVVLATSTRRSISPAASALRDQLLEAAGRLPPRGKP